VNSDRPYHLKTLKLICFKLKQATKPNNYSQFWFSIIERAILDLSINTGNTLGGSIRNIVDGKRVGLTEPDARAIRMSSIEYFQSDRFIHDCHACGLDLDYVQRIISALLYRTKKVAA